MKTYYQKYIALSLCTIILLLLTSITANAESESAAILNKKVDTALQTLYSTTPVAKDLAKRAKGILIFPDVIKGGLIVGGQYGEGALRKNGKTTGYYNTAAASYGLQIGAQSFGYAMFFMTDEAVKYLESSDGWEIGVGPSIVVVDAGVAQALTTSTSQDNIYAFFFSQKGLMAGLGIQGSKISKINMK